jgi:hypothetical protein
MNLRQKIAVIITDVLLIAEVCISMYLSSQQAPENLTPTFLKSFFIMCVPTLVIAKVTISRLRTPETSSGAGATAGDAAAAVKPSDPGDLFFGCMR